MRILHYLGVWHIFIAVLFLCAHRPFIALCHETGTSSSPTTSGKPKTQGTSSTGSATDQAKVPPGGSKKDVSLDPDSKEDQEDTESSSDESDDEELGSVKKQDDNTGKDIEVKPVVSSSEKGVSDQQGDTGSLSEDTPAPSEITNEDASVGTTTLPSHSSKDAKETDAKKSQEAPDSVENIFGAAVAAEGLGEQAQPLSDEEDDAGSSGADTQLLLESEKVTPGERIPRTNKPSSTTLQMDSPPPEPMPVAAPATEPVTKEQPPEETGLETKPSEAVELTGDGGEPEEGREAEILPAEDAESPEGGEKAEKVGKGVEEGGGEQPADKKPDEEKPADKKPEEEKPTDKKPEEEKPADKKPEEEMPSFDEWKEKMLQEEELKKREQGQSSKSHAAPPARPKFSLNENSKNHASSDCGAKLLSTNKEAQSPSAILNINPDLYMLNPCTANIKFIVELCEPIQIKQIEIANYELFSSVPESFRVSISDRYPAREWHLLGTFHARNERVLQSFPLHEEQMFAKYMKFEMLTFFGSEHYCPLSVLRVFGTNVVEEIEDADAADDVIDLDSPPEVLPLHPTPVPDDESSHENGLLESARDVVLGLVKRAAKVLTGREDSERRDEHTPCFPEDAPSNDSMNATSELTTDPGQLHYEEHLEICMPSIYNQCVGIDVDFSDVRQLCRGRSCCFCPNYAERFEYCRSPKGSYGQSNFQCCKDTSLCGLRSDDKETGSYVDKAKAKESDNEQDDGEKSEIVSDSEMKDEVKVEDTKKLSVIDTQSEIERTEDKVITNSQTRTSVESGVLKETQTSQKLDDSNIVPPKDKTLVFTAAPSLEKPIASVVINVSSLREIQPTKSVPPPAAAKTETAQDSVTKATQIVLETGIGGGHKLEPTVDVNQGAPSQSSAVEKTPSIGESGNKTEIDDTAKTEQEVPKSSESESTTKPVERDKVDAEPLNGSAKTEGSAKADSSVKTDTPAKVPKASVESGMNGASNTGIMMSHQKESVFMRLNNRIKSLELNMSLSSRYLEELSQRYRKQMEEMQKAFNKTITKLTENAQTAQERDTQQQAYISKLETKLTDITLQLENTTQRVDSVIREVVERHLVLMFVEILVMSLLFLFCIGRRPARIYIPVENGIPSSVKSPVQNPVGKTVPATAAAAAAASSKGRSANKDAGRTMHASPRRRNRSFGECTPAKASATNTGGGSCDDLLIIGHTTPFLEALNQADSPDGAPKRRGKHKGRHKITAKSSSLTSVPLTNGDHHDEHPVFENTQAGLLFRGSGRKDQHSSESSIVPNGAIKRLFRSGSIGRIEELKGDVHLEEKTDLKQQLPLPPIQIGPKQQPHKTKQQKVESSAKNITAPPLKQPSTSTSILSSSSQPKAHGKGFDKRTRSSPGLQQMGSRQTSPGRPPHPSGSSGTKRQPKKPSPVMNGKR